MSSPVPSATPAATPTFAVDVLRSQVATLQGRLGDAVSQARRLARASSLFKKGSDHE